MPRHAGQVKLVNTNASHKIKLLLPFDETGFSQHIIPQVVRLFPASHTALYLVHVQKPTATLSNNVRYRYGSSSSQSIDNQFDKEGLDSYTKSLKQKLEQEALSFMQKGYEVHACLRAGDAVEEIVSMITEENLDAVAMASRGHTGVSQVLLGSVAQAVFARVNIPVLLLRSSPSP